MPNQIMPNTEAKADTFAGRIHNAAPETVKDSFTRLLDLMLGWAQYAENDEAEHSDTVQAADIYDAYNAVAEFAEPYWDAPPQAQEAAVREFMELRLLPLLLGKKEKTVLTAPIKPDLRTAAQRLWKDNVAEEKSIIAVYLFPSDREIRLVYLDAATASSRDSQTIAPFYFGSNTASGLPYPSAVAVIQPEEKETLQPPQEWGGWEQAERVWPEA